MKYFTLALTSAAFLAGCGTLPGASSVQPGGTKVGAQSRATVVQLIRSVADKAFKHMDRNGDGMVTLAELETRGQRAWAQQEMARHDANQDGKIARSEYQQSDEQVQALAELLCKEAASIFKDGDKNRDGFLNPSEVPDAAAFAAADVNKDGKLTLSEFENQYVKELVTDPSLDQ